MSSCIRVRLAPRCQAGQRSHEHSKNVGASALSKSKGNSFHPRPSIYLPVVYRRLKGVVKLSRKASSQTLEQAAVEAAHTPNGKVHESPPDTKG